MATVVGFRGLLHIAPGDAFFAPPFGGPLHDGVKGWLPGDEAEFSRGDAELVGRACDGDGCPTAQCNGTCYAKTYVEEWNRQFPDEPEPPFYLGSRKREASTAKAQTTRAVRRRAGTRKPAPSRNPTEPLVPSAGTATTPDGTAGSGTPEPADAGTPTFVGTPASAGTGA